jgi:hypothetical protein
MLGNLSGECTHYWRNALGTQQQYANTLGLICDMVGACLLAYEIIKTNRHPQTIDTGAAGAINGSTNLITNPAYEQYEKRKHCFMWIGMLFLLAGFGLQIYATWI